ncbi:Protease Do-like 1, chloroplastic [Linum grandiflorum]
MVRVTLSDQSAYDATVVGFDQDKDVAVLRVDAPKDKLKPIPVGVSADLLVGQKVYAIGNPFGLDHTLTTGVISGLRREISSAATGRPIQDVIQTDAAINPGNSGGPLLDSAGNLIGINTAIYSPSGASSGVGFSIPVDTVSGIVDQLVKFGKVTRPILGIKFAPDQSVEQLGVSGVLVLDAPANGPAGKAGLQPTKRDAYGRLVLGDIITSLNGKKVTNGSDLYRILDQCNVGDKIIVEVLRGDHKEKIPVILEPKPDES